jgi:hypothetical protein
VVISQWLVLVGKEIFTRAEGWWPKTFLPEQMGGRLVYILRVISVHLNYVEVERVSRFLYHINITNSKLIELPFSKKR